MLIVIAPPPERERERALALMTQYINTIMYNASVPREAQRGAIILDGCAL